jgi:hypothetical protein
MINDSVLSGHNQRRIAIGNLGIASPAANIVPLAPPASDFKCVNETLRVYTFPGGDKIEIENVSAVCVRPSGNHHLETANGRKIIVSSGWLSIEFTGTWEF